jgi:hypothetical protein
LLKTDPRRTLHLASAGTYRDAQPTLSIQMPSIPDNRYLAAHRVLFLRDQECREVLIRASESFLEAGWPSARRLIYGLDDMFR